MRVYNSYLLIKYEIDPKTANACFYILELSGLMFLRSDYRLTLFPLPTACLRLSNSHIFYLFIILCISLFYYYYLKTITLSDFLLPYTFSYTILLFYNFTFLTDTLLGSVRVPVQRTIHISCHFLLLT